MKLLTWIVLAMSLAGISYGQAPAEYQHALIIRSTSGRVLDDRGFPTSVVPLSKGQDYNVVEQKVGYLVISVGGKKVSVPPGDTTVSKGKVAERSTTRPAKPIIVPAGVEPPALVAVTPGTIEILSAKYTLMGNQPRNVKTKLLKLIPAGVIDKSVNVLVSDALSTAASSQGNMSYVRTSTSTYTLQEHPKNILTVEYLFNGESRTKQAVEGTYMTLP